MSGYNDKCACDKCKQKRYGIQMAGFALLGLWFVTLFIQGLLQTKSFTPDRTAGWFGEVIVDNTLHENINFGRRVDEVLTSISALSNEARHDHTRKELELVEVLRNISEEYQRLEEIKHYNNVDMAPIFFAFSAIVWGFVNVLIYVIWEAVSGARARRAMFWSLLSGVLGFAWTILVMGGNGAFRDTVLLTVWPFTLCVTGTMGYEYVNLNGCLWRKEEVLEAGETSCKEKSMC